MKNWNLIITWELSHCVNRDEPYTDIINNLIMQGLIIAKEAIKTHLLNDEVISIVVKLNHLDEMLSMFVGIDCTRVSAADWATSVDINISVDSE